MHTNKKTTSRKHVKIKRKKITSGIANHFSLRKKIARKTTIIKQAFRVGENCCSLMIIFGCECESAKIKNKTQLELTKSIIFKPMNSHHPRR
jgi:hypothetical protein